MGAGSSSTRPSRAWGADRWLSLVTSSSGSSRRPAISSAARTTSSARTRIWRGRRTTSRTRARIRLAVSPGRTTGPGIRSARTRSARTRRRPTPTRRAAGRRARNSRRTWGVDQARRPLRHPVGHDRRSGRHVRSERAARSRPRGSRRARRRDLHLDHGGRRGREEPCTVRVRRAHDNTTKEAKLNAILTDSFGSTLEGWEQIARYSEASGLSAETIAEGSRERRPDGAADRGLAERDRAEVLRADRAGSISKRRCSPTSRTS